MKYYPFFFMAIFLMSCSNERVLQLPEIQGAEVTEVLDVSPAYLFYDESQPDSTLLNRKNLISTTNWLVNVDRRLTLKQAIPHIKYMQDKKRNAKMHKNENAKNFYTCNDTTIENLGFVEFTNTFYFDSPPTLEAEKTTVIALKVNSLEDISINSSLNANISNFRNVDLNSIHSIKQVLKDNLKLQLHISDKITFQDYITLKQKLNPIKSSISPNEYIY
ncbi:hypothetical protein [Winogradskyella alexanderae]|uniref:Uncharacterized protein n=1 Tax=Winogradskyella alexanderae TaxID=2877123 RepID=A0ABS7XV09_9FLAO|nr:hypothetical protein [Winogradskyella alexanderae]MCA0133848.1 hypothetical protein [Winogradskyella alexanderae]